MATKRRRRREITGNIKSSTREHLRPLGYIGVIAVVISLAFLGIQLNNNISLLVGNSFGGAAVNGQGVSDLPWWNNAWQYRAPVTVKETAALAHNQYIVEFELNTFDLISKGKLKADCSDLRVVNTKGEVQMHDLGLKLSPNKPLTQGCDKTNTLIKIRTDIPANQDNEFLQVYYGNPSATAVTSGAVSYWRERTTLPYTTAAERATQYNGQVYLIGGQNAQETHDKYYVYSPDTNTWTAKSPLPFRIVRDDLTFASGRLYVLGGQTYNAQREPIGYNVDDIFELPVGSDVWKKIDGAQLGVGDQATYFTMVTLNNKIHVLGGPASAPKRHKIYDPVADTWINGAPLVVGTQRPVAAIIENKIYLLQDEGSIHRVYTYDEVADKWVAKSDFAFGKPISQIMAWGIFGDDKLGVFSVDKNSVYDTKTKSWKEIPLAPVSQYTNYAGAAVDGKMYLVGGTSQVDIGTPYVYLNTNWEYTLPNWELDVKVLAEEKFSDQIIGIQDDDDDGVPNANDLCSNTPAGETVDATGCIPPSGNQTANDTTTQPQDTSDNGSGNIIDQIIDGDKSVKCKEDETLVGSKCIRKTSGESICGNDKVEDGEQCDGISAVACPGLCTASCGCKYIPNDKVCDKKAGEVGADCDKGTLVWIGVLLILLVGGGVFWYFRYYLGLEGFDYESIRARFMKIIRGGKSSARSSVTSSGSSSKGASESEIKSYIASTKSMGYSSSQIRSALKRKGWSGAIIDRYLGTA